MPAKRALIVDDSRSARVILSRMLETYGLQVDAAESGEQAIEYLRTSQPDVIFMDHLMPGMDGFETVRAIKVNPESAAIPILMYTSQEGDMYAKQARALGAVGVVPKTVKQVDVLRVLYQLHLLTERREPNSNVVAAQVVAANEGSAMPRAVPPPRSEDFPARPAANSFTAALQEQNAELRRFVLASLEAFGRRIVTEIKGAPAAEAQPASSPADAAVPAAAPTPPDRQWLLVASLATLALIPTVALGVLYWRVSDSIDALTTANARLTNLVAEQRAQTEAALRQAAATPSPPPEAPADAAPSSTPPPAAPTTTPASTRQIEVVPYGELPLAGARFDKFRDFLERLRAQNFKGTIRATAYVGDFCLTGNGIEGFSVAADDLPLRRCDVTGNPFEDSLTTAQRQSLAFANLAANVRKESNGAILITVNSQGRKPQVQYPDAIQNEKLTAGEWNRVAARNNRVEFSTEPAR